MDTTELPLLSACSLAGSTVGEIKTRVAVVDLFILRQSDAWLYITHSSHISIACNRFLNRLEYREGLRWASEASYAMCSLARHAITRNSDPCLPVISNSLPATWSSQRGGCITIALGPIVNAITAKMQNRLSAELDCINMIKSRLAGWVQVLRHVAHEEPLPFRDFEHL